MRMGKGRLAVDGGEPVIKGELPSWPWFDEETIKAAMEPLRTGALNIGPGDEVITTPYSFIATSFCVLQAGAIPVFADVRREDHCIDPDEIRKKITKRTKAIIPVHL
ncbi:TPA: DegT/DnrJ/EryC1/StrS family aminotransferase, partial [Candidatus Poribacteria bacterium]|nr:DegT/DnrJ/EryC1/StrS family aminotransferase [Candidatus Poribacteria bacterium]HEX30280.1 DegT/DnrJ/EryC1/StrS family aminotransferase [Candidatus Poribacteria bacterium]